MFQHLREQIRGKMVLSSQAADNEALDFKVQVNLPSRRIRPLQMVNLTLPMHQAPPSTLILK